MWSLSFNLWPLGDVLDGYRLPPPTHTAAPLLYVVVVIVLWL